MGKAIILCDVGPVTRRFADPAYVGVGVKDIKVANKSCEGRGRGKDAMTGLTGDLIKHVDEVKEKNNAGRVVWIR